MIFFRLNAQLCRYTKDIKGGCFMRVGATLVKGSIQGIIKYSTETCVRDTPFSLAWKRCCRVVVYNCECIKGSFFLKRYHFFHK